MKTFSISDAQKNQFHEEGYMILECVIPPDMLAIMREECSYFLGYMDAALDAAGKDGAGFWIAAENGIITACASNRPTATCPGLHLSG